MVVFVAPLAEAMIVYSQRTRWNRPEKFPIHGAAQLEEHHLNDTSRQAGDRANDDRHGFLRKTNSLQPIRPPQVRNSWSTNPWA